MKPLIGIGADILTPQDGGKERAFNYLSYVEAVRKAGGIPLLIPPQADAAAAILCRIDGLVLVGGNDCDPALWGEEPHPSIVPMDRRRQASDLELARGARSLGIPTLGVCLGMQMMAIASGGRIIQDIASEIDTPITHAGTASDRPCHEIVVREGTRLAEIVGSGRHLVNSTHHQAIRNPVAGLRVSAEASDGIVEAIEDPGHPYYLGVQWHPEDMVGEPAGEGPFRGLVDAARGRTEARREVPAEVGRMAPER
ncbi:MAG TPA: gamma-glutamyl-gamma-aminobutyrate hydrolase family protein [Thermoanaerobaculia bacterium]|nr:gamma-glutamyl-gamma-aminobutyrate hydrolase family protein [Thermoanaerobaculia bacterium]